MSHFYIRSKMQLIFVLTFTSLLLQAQSNLRFTKFDMDNGLSYNSALCLCQDQENNVWIGTRDGLNKYNGIDNQIFKQSINNAYSLSNSDINCIYESTSKELWIGTAYGLNLYQGSDHFLNYLPINLNDTTVRNRPLLSNGYIRCISEAKDGALWIGTLSGLNVLNKEKNEISTYFIDKDHASANNIITLLHGDAQQLFIGTAAGLYLKRGDVFEPVIFDETHGKHEIRDLKQSRDGQLWVATENHGVYHFYYDDHKAKEMINITTANSIMTSNSVRKLYLEDSSCWIATLKGVSRVDSQGEITNITYSPRNPQGISNSSVHDILKDHLGGYWMATYSGGVNYYHPQNNLFTTIPFSIKDASGLEDDDITSITEDKDANLWIATNTAGLYYWNVKTDTYVHYYQGKTPRLASNNIKSLSLDQQNNLWVASYNGLYFYNKVKNSWQAFRHQEGNENSLNFNQVHVVLADKMGQVWIGMNGGDFQMYDPQVKRMTTIRGVGKYVECLYEDSKGHLWIGGPQGLNCLDTKTKNFIDVSRALDGFYNQLKNINCITEDSHGRLWIGTKGTGIFVLDNGKVMGFDEKDGLNDNIINMIQEDQKGRMWLSTNKGLSELSYRRTNNQKATIECIHYTTIDGLQGKQFEKGCGCDTQAGVLLFGGIHGINAVHPERVKKKDYFPKVVLSDFTINKETLNSQEYSPITESKNAFHLNYNERNISLHFVGIHYINPEGIFYRYRLTGSTDAWIYLGHQRSLNFIDLSPGEYTLQIQASSNNAIWGAEFSSFDLDVKPPYWRSWLAYFIYFCLAGLLVFLIVRYYERMVKLKNSLTISQYKSEHDKILNESKFRFFTDISHELRTPLTLILGPLEYIINKEQGLDSDSQRQLTKMQHNGNRMLRLVNQVLNLRKLEGGFEKLHATANNILEMVDTVYSEFRDIAQDKEVSIAYQTDLEEAVLWYDKDKIESVIYNLLSNAIKNTPKGESISLRMSKEEYNDSEKFKHKDYIVLSIKNTGDGISPEESKHLFERFYSKHDAVSSTGVGLELTKRIVDLHHGHIWVESNLKTDDTNGYALFSVALPLGKNHLSEDEIAVEEGELIHSKTLNFDHLKEHKPLLADSTLHQGVSKAPKLTLLVVEDNAEMRGFIKDLLYLKYNIVEADNGIDGWKISLKLLPDLIISDVMMPLSDGIELCKAVKGDVRTSHIPIILLTARSGKTHHMDGLESGADDYITKPFSADFLSLRIENLLRQRQLYQKHFSQQALLEPETITISTVDDKLLKKAVDYISASMEDSHLSVEILSQEVGLSRVHFYRKIKALTGLTAVEFIRSIRLKRAATLLETPSLSVKEIQLKVGFENADYFRKCFKEYYSLTPTEYRQKIMVEELKDTDSVDV